MKLQLTKAPDTAAVRGRKRTKNKNPHFSDGKVKRPICLASADVQRIYVCVWRCDRFRHWRRVGRRSIILRSELEYCQNSPRVDVACEDVAPSGEGKVVVVFFCFFFWGGGGGGGGTGDVACKVVAL